MYKYAIISIFLSLLISCSSSKRDKQTKSKDQEILDSLYKYISEAEQGIKSKDYLAKCTCEKTGDYIEIIENNNNKIARYSINGKTQEFDINNCENRMVDETATGLTKEYLFFDDSKNNLVKFIVKEGRDRVKTVTKASIQYKGKTREMICLGNTIFNREESPNIDLNWIENNPCAEKEQGLYIPEKHLTDTFSINKFLSRLSKNNRFIREIKYKGEELEFIEGGCITPRSDYSLRFEKEVIDKYIEFTGLPFITFWDMEYGHEVEINEINIEETEIGLKISLMTYSPAFDASDTCTIQYIYKSKSFRSKIRPDYKNWEIGKTYTDTLKFLSYNTDTDYWFGIFLTKKGDKVNLIYDEEIGEEYKNKLLIIKWKIDKFYSAGEEEEMYYAERLISFEILNK